MVSVGDNGKAELDALGLDFSLDLVDDVDDCFFGFGEV